MRLPVVSIIACAFIAAVGCRPRLNSAPAGRIELHAIDTLTVAESIVEGYVQDLRTKRMWSGGSVHFEASLKDSIAVAPDPEKYGSFGPATMFFDLAAVHTLVDTSGHFVVRALPPGEYEVSYSEPTMVDARYRPKLVVEPGKRYHLRVLTTRDPGVSIIE